jgi:rubredoxin
MIYEKVRAALVMELNVECPECDHGFDLFITSENDEGGVSNQVLPDERWKIDADDRLEVDTHCPECSTEFEVKGVDW